MIDFDMTSSSINGLDDSLEKEDDRPRQQSRKIVRTESVDSAVDLDTPAGSRFGETGERARSAAARTRTAVAQPPPPPPT